MLGSGPVNFPLHGMSACARQDLDKTIQGNGKSWDQDFIGEEEEAVGPGVMVTCFVPRSSEFVHLAEPLQLRHGVLRYQPVLRLGGRTANRPNEGLGASAGRDVMKGRWGMQVG